MANVLFIKTANSTFMLQDIMLIKKHFPTKVFTFKYGPFFRVLQSQIALALWLLTNIWSADLIYIWFADYHSLIPVLFAKVLGKKSLIVIAGPEAQHYPRLNWGAHLRRGRSACVKISCHLATFILPVSVDCQRVILEHCTARSRLTYCGMDPQRFQSNRRKANLVLTACDADWDVRRVFLKGLDLFAEIAALMPETEFVIVGLGGEARALLEHRGLPKNLRILPRMPLDELATWYQRARVYCQLSLVETFGMALAEAMLCKCIPVGSNNGAIPEVIGDTGFLLEDRDTHKAARIVGEALRSDLGTEARQRVIDLFSLRRREARLREVIEDALVHW